MQEHSLVQEQKSGETLHVFVTVSGGVAYAAQVPSGVQLHILDFDDLEADRTAALNYMSEIERSFLHDLELGEALAKL